MNNKIPPLRIAVTPTCNMKCKYCPCNGESGLLKNRLLEEKEFEKIVHIGYRCGIKSFSITGGEPLIIPLLTFELTHFIRSLPQISYVKLNTNGILIAAHIEEIKKANFNQIKVSLDSLKEDTHNLISSCPQGYKKTIEGIELLVKNQIPVRLQIVVGKYNFEEFEDLIDFAISKQIDVCIFDMLFFESNKSKGNIFWQDNYSQISDITKLLKKKYKNIKEIHSVGEFGHHISEIDTHQGTKIQVRNTLLGSHYSEICKNCKYYKCTEGLCTLVLSADGRLKICRNEGFDISLLNNNGTLKSDSEIEAAFVEIIKIFQSSTFEE